MQDFSVSSLVINEIKLVHFSMYRYFFKRLFDILLSGIAIVVLSPLLLVVAAFVRFKLGSPVIFKQKRPGKIDKKTGNEKIFCIYKFRTMTDERDAEGNLLSDVDRLTKFGRLLRATSLDELPELINIFKGDMSIVGPRPLAVSYLPYYTPTERHRHDVRPGLTGLAQVNGRNSISWESKFSYDLKYVSKITLLGDLKIIFSTIKKVIVRDGIGQGESHPGSLNELRSDWIDENGILKEPYINM